MCIAESARSAKARIGTSREGSNYSLTSSGVEGATIEEKTKNAIFGFLGGLALGSFLTLVILGIITNP